MYVNGLFNNVTLTSHNMTLKSEKPCQYINKFYFSQTNGYNISQDYINKVYVCFSFNKNIAINEVYVVVVVVFSKKSLYRYVIEKT